MRVLRSTDAWPQNLQHAVLALGNFDGLHRGHRAVIEAALEMGKKGKHPVGVLTFEPHPRGVLKPGSAPPRLVTLSEKLRLLKSAGIDFCYLQRFTPAFSQTSAERFLEEQLLQQMQIAHLVTGENFVFGKNRGGNPELVKKYVAEKKLQFTQVKPVEMEGTSCSSTRIRQALNEGNIPLAEKLLGRPYALSGRVMKGEQRGRKLGFPTANIPITQTIIPALGIYAVRLTENRRKWRDGVASIGVNPTFGGLDKPRLEVFSLQEVGNIYGKKFHIELVAYLRPEMKFDSEESLKKQMESDCMDAKAALLRYKETHENR